MQAWPRPKRIQADDDGGGVGNDEGEGFELGPDGDEFGALHGGGEQDAATVPAEAESPEGEEHGQVQHQAAGQAGQEGAQEGTKVGDVRGHDL